MSLRLLQVQTRIRFEGTFFIHTIKTRALLWIFCCVLNSFQHLDINAHEQKLASFTLCNSRYFKQILFREKGATVTVDVVDTKGDEKTLR